MSELLTQLESLQVELHEVNQELSKASRPLRRADELNLEQRQKLAIEIRARLARWETVTQQITHLIFTNGRPN